LHPNHSHSPPLFGPNGENGGPGFESNTFNLTESNIESSATLKEQHPHHHQRNATTAPVNPWDIGMSAYRDFFGVLPTQPRVPQRIEPKDVIVKNEDLTKIRKKFQLLADNAVRQIKSSGKSSPHPFSLLSIMCLTVPILLDCLLLSRLSARCDHGEWQESSTNRRTSSTHL
jgi:hypothetical protein